MPRVDMTPRETYPTISEPSDSVVGMANDSSVMAVIETH